MPEPKPTSNISKRSKWLLVVVALLFVSVSGFYFLTAGIRDAKRIEQTLIDRFDWANKHTPAINGSIAPERIEKFIRVRQSVQTNCTDYQAILNSLIKLENMEANEDSTASEAASTGMESLKSVFSAGPTMLAFSEARNQALLDEEMGIGEYMYIYLSAYAEQLATESTSPYSAMEEAYPSSRTRKEFTQILNNQLAALQASGQTSSITDLENSLQQEIEALETAAQPSAWPARPVEPARESLAPYQQQLSDLYCSGIVSIELLQKNRGFQLEG
jgi:hypothetical protein